MKKFLKYLLVYLMFYSVGMIIGTFFYASYISITKFTIGVESRFFDIGIISQSAFLISFCLNILIGPMLCYFKIRHSSTYNSLISFILLEILTWGLVFPMELNLKNYIDANYTFNSDSHDLTGEYFRKSEDKIYYFTKDLDKIDFSSSTPDTIVIDTTDQGSVVYKKSYAGDFANLYGEASPYNENEVKSIFPMLNYSKFLKLGSIVDLAITSYEKGWSFYLGFLSMIVALSSLFVLTNYFTWNLINTAFIMISSFAILSFNYLFYSPLLIRLRELGSDNKIIIFCKTYVSEPVLIMCNLIIAITLTVVGVVNHIKVKRITKNN